MAFNGKYQLESQENYEEFLKAIDFLQAKTDQIVITEVEQKGNDFTWTQSIPGWTYTNKFTIGQECELETLKRVKFKALVTMEDGKISIPFPQYMLTAEIIDDKLVMICVTRGKESVAFKRISKKLADP